MADSSCHGPDCFYTGTSQHSNAIPGRCTKTPGYIADAELNELVSNTKRSGRVNRQFYDASSGSDIIIFDDNQFGAHMSPATKQLRRSMYMQLHMGGTSDWDCTLQQFNDPPAPCSSWGQCRRLIISGKDIYNLDPSGNYTELKCPTSSVESSENAAELWRNLGCADAWNDVVKQWKRDPQRNNTSVKFTDFITTTLHSSINADCGDLGPTNYCNSLQTCVEVVLNGGSPAGHVIWDSLVNIHQAGCPNDRFIRSFIFYYW